MIDDLGNVGFCFEWILFGWSQTFARFKFFQNFIAHFGFIHLASRVRYSLTPLYRKIP